MRTFTIDGRSVQSFADFVTVTNVGFIEQVGGRWNGNLDALNDYLSWPHEEHYRLELIGAENCALRLGHAAYAVWLSECLGTCHPSNIADVRSQLARAEAGEGETLFDIIRDIIFDSEQVQLVLR